MRQPARLSSLTPLVAPRIACASEVLLFVSAHEAEASFVVSTLDRRTWLCRCTLALAMTRLEIRLKLRLRLDASTNHSSWIFASLASGGEPRRRSPSASPFTLRENLQSRNCFYQLLAFSTQLLENL